MRLKRVFLIMLTVCLAFFVTPIHADDYDFPNNEDYYYDLCSKTGLTSEQKTACKAFQSYVTQKAGNLQNEIDKFNSQIADVKKDINAVMKKINEYNDKIESIEREQAKIEKQINTIEGNIAVIEAQIEERERTIKQLDEQIKERMYNIQSFVSLDQYIEFIMGASDFIDLLRRTSALNDIMSYDTGQIKKLEAEKELLAQDQAELEEQKDALDAQRDILLTNKQSIEKLRDGQKELEAYYLSKEAELLAEKRGYVNDLDDLLDALNDISKALGSVSPSPGWILPIKTGWRISAGAFYYPKSFGGGLHLGVDFAASSSRKIVAPANGVVVYTYDKCGRGYYGNACGGVWGGGNMVVMVVQVGSHTYGIQMCHMSRGVSNYVKAGTVVTQGTTLGYVGTSGNSTGNHLHIEIYDLGTKSLSSAVKSFSKNGDVTFGTRWNTVSTTCDKKGSTPCRINPLKIFNVKYGQSG